MELGPGLWWAHETQKANELQGSEMAETYKVLEGPSPKLWKQLTTAEGGGVSSDQPRCQEEILWSVELPARAPGLEL